MTNSAIKWLLSAIFNWALNTGAVTTNPVEKAERPKGTGGDETHTYTMSEFKAILKARRRTGRQNRDRHRWPHRVAAVGVAGIAMGRFAG
jgi:hypothetical protein